MSSDDYGRISIFVLVDALGWEHVQGHEFLSDILPFRSAVDTVLGFSSAAIPTILSGEMPDVHSHWCLFRKAKFPSCFSWTVPLALFPGRLRENHRTRRVIAVLTRAMFRISGYFCLYEVPVSILHRLDYVEKKNVWQPGALSGCPTIFDKLISCSVPYYASGWKGTDESRVAASVSALSRTPVQCCFVYLSELDATLHTFGLESKEVREALTAASVRIRKLLARARELYSEVELFVFSDHGMTSVTEGHDLQSLLASRGPDGSRYMAFFDSTLARFWPKDTQTREALEEVLSSLPYGTVLSETDLSELGLSFRTDEYGEVIFVMNPGHLVVPSFVSSGVPKAMHGFHPSDCFSRACFLSCKELDCPPRHIRDIHSFFMTQLSLESGRTHER